VVDLALEHRLPSLSPNRAFVEAGGLLGYTAKIADLHREAAAYVDKILEGRKPADLPVMQPNKFELLVNLKTAKTLGLDVPPMLLARADEVIE
jgi:putative ABC transport system substrate-binding protein